MKRSWKCTLFVADAYVEGARRQIILPKELVWFRTRKICPYEQLTSEETQIEAKR